MSFSNINKNRYFSLGLTFVVIIVTILSASECLAWQPPIGIPEPEFGIFETYRMYDNPANRNPSLNYTQNEEEGFYTHYVDSTDEETTDTDNPYGTIAKPRETVPKDLPEGAVVEVHNNMVDNGYDFFNATGVGSEEKPIFIRGIDEPVLTGNARKMLVGYYGDTQYIIVEGFKFILGIIMGREEGSFQNNHISVRSCEFTNPGSEGGVNIYNNKDGLYGSYIVFYNNSVHDYGDWTAYDEGDQDIGGLTVNNNIYYLWIVDNQFYHNQYDGVQIAGSYGGESEVSPDDEHNPHHIYVGRNVFYENIQPGFWTKTARDVIFSQNTAYEHRHDTSWGVVNAGGGSQYDPVRVWFIFNHLYDNHCGLRIASQQNGWRDETYMIGNLIYDCYGVSWDDEGEVEGLAGYADGIYINGLKDASGTPLIAFNTIYNCSSAITNAYHVTNTEFNAVNNIFADCDQTYLNEDEDVTFGNRYIWLQSSEAAGNCAMDYNLLYNSGGIRWDQDYQSLAAFQAGTVHGDNCIEADPLFVNADSHNFHLQSGSPAIDEALSTGVVEDAFDRFEELYGIDIRKDIEGKPRIGAWDIGAYEYTLNAVTDLSVSGTSQNSVTFSWTMPSDDGLASMPSRYDIRYATSTLTEANWSAATQVQGEPAPGDFGTGRSFTITGLNPGTTYYIGIKTSNETGSTTSLLSNVISGTTATTGNHAPVLASIGDKSFEDNELLTFTVNATDADEGATLTYSATDLPPNASFNPATRTFTWTPTDSQGGTYHVTFQVTDGSVAVTETIRIIGDEAPVLAAIGNKSVSEGSLLSFTISATDPEGDAITYSATDLPAGAAFVGRTFSWTPGHTQAGTHNVTFIASDGAAQDSETITITVNNSNRAPVLNTIGDKFTNESTLLTFGVSATEPDGQAVTYSATGLPAGATFAGQTFSWTPSAGHVGNNYPVTFTASDGQLSDSETVHITVMSDTTAPTVSNLSPAADSIQAPLNSLIILHVTDAGVGVDAGTVTITLDGDTIYTGDTSDYSSATGNCRRSGTKADYTYAYQSSHIFDFDESKNVTVNATDLFGNVMTERSYSFMTEMRSFGQNIRVDTTVQGINKAAPSTARDSSGNIWAVWHAGPSGRRNIYVAKLRAGRDTFDASVRLASNSADQANPAIALGTDDKLHVVWQDNRHGDWDIYSSTSVDGTNWTTQTRVNDPNEGSQVNPAIVVDSRSPNYAYVVWQDDRAGNQDICVASSSNGFGTKTVSQITSNTSNQTTPAIAVNSANMVYVLWTDARNASNDIYGAAGSTWTNVPIVTKAGSQSNPAIAVESAGSILHMLWVDQISGNSDIYYAPSNGMPGSPLTGTNLIDDTLGKEQRSPTIAVTGSTGNDLKVFACWRDERNVSGNSGDTDLYMVQTNSGVGTNVFVGDGGINSDQVEPAMSTDQYGYPCLVWTDDRSTNTEIYFAGSVYLKSTALASEMTAASSGGTVGTDPGSINDVEDVSVVLPAGACPYDVTISITKIENQHEYGSLPCLSAYDFSPSGMAFSTPVTITIPYTVTGGAGTPTVYWYDSRSFSSPLSRQGITDIKTIVITSSLHALRFKTTHFTQFYVVLGTPAKSVSDHGGSSGGGGGGGGGCSLSHCQDVSIIEYFLPYGALALFMLITKLRNRGYKRNSDKDLHSE